MNTKARKNSPERYLVYLILVATVFTLSLAISTIPPAQVSAHSGTVFNSGCGKATIDGKVGSAEWTHASSLTFPLVSFQGQDPFTGTLHVMNTQSYLYIGFTVNDDEYSSGGQYGDSVILIFDNEHSGTLFQLNHDALILAAVVPQFRDYYLYNVVYGSIQADINDGGTADGMGAASRVTTLNNFEEKHPLCSGDSHDFCIHPSDTVGFRLEYLDRDAGGTIEGTQLYPGPEVTSEADIVIGTCSVAENSIYLPLIKK
jgi:hypothetical protein